LGLRAAHRTVRPRPGTSYQFPALAGHRVAAFRCGRARTGARGSDGRDRRGTRRSDASGRPSSAPRRTLLSRRRLHHGFLCFPPGLGDLPLAHSAVRSMSQNTCPPLPSGTFVTSHAFIVESGRKSPAHHAFGSVIFLIWMLIYLVTFVAGLYALVEAVRTPASAFELMDKQTKKLWVILTGVATGLSGIAVFTGRGVLIVM